MQTWLQNCFATSTLSIQATQAQQLEQTCAQPLAQRLNAEAVGGTRQQCRAPVPDTSPRRPQLWAAVQSHGNGTRKLRATHPLVCAVTTVQQQQLAVCHGSNV